MDPLTIMVIGTAVSAAAQYYNSEKARGASQDELNKIKKMFDGIVPPNYDLSIEDPPELHEQRLAEPQFADAMAAPDWNLDKLDPEDLKLVEKFSPEIAPLIKEAAPQTITKSEDMREGSEAQKTALRKFMDVGEGGFDPEYQQKIQVAKDRAQGEAQSRGASITQDFERRGMGGSGMELAAKIGASSQAMDRNASMGMQAEAEAYRNQLAALSQGAQLGGDIYRRFQDWEVMKANAINQADLRNIQEAQRISDTNINQGNDAARDDRSRLDNITKFNYGAAVDERGRQDDLSRGKYDRDASNRSYMDAREILQSKWKQDNVDRGNDLLDKRFQNQNSLARGQAGLADANIKQIRGTAQDQNSMIQGMTNAGIAYYGGQADRDFKTKQNAMDREAYKTRPAYTSAEYTPAKRPPRRIGMYDNEYGGSGGGSWS